jgi:cleavage and polyadenylation specificity factor subunit 2
MKILSRNIYLCCIARMPFPAPDKYISSTHPSIDLWATSHALLRLRAPLDPPTHPNPTSSFRSLPPNLAAVDCRALEGIDAVLLSHGDLAHAGGLAYAFRTLGLTCPIYATQPVAKFAPLALREAALAWDSEHDGNIGDGAPFTVADIEQVFRNHVHALTFSQSAKLLLQSSGTPIEITPFAAGHTVGGALWKSASPARHVDFFSLLTTTDHLVRRAVTVGSEAIVYAPDYNNNRDRMLDYMAIESISRAHVLLFGTTSAM